MNINANQIKAVAADTAIVDTMAFMPSPLEVAKDGRVYIHNDPVFTNYANHYGLNPDCTKVLIEDRAEFDELAHHLSEKYPATNYPGGSSLNIAVTMSRILGDRIRFTFLSAVGNEPEAKSIHDLFDECAIELFPSKKHDMQHQTAKSCVTVFEDGSRFSFIYPGNTKQVISPNVLSDALSNRQDLMLLQGSGFEKFKPGFVDQMLGLRRNMFAKLILTMPTSKKFNTHTAALFRSLIHEENPEIIGSNNSELQRVYEMETEGDTYNRFQQALMKNKYTYEDDSIVGFITRGAKGATVVSAREQHFIDALPTSAITSEIGAGDTALAVFICSQLDGHDYVSSARIAMYVTRAKLYSASPQPPEAKAHYDAAVKLFNPKLVPR